MITFIIEIFYSSYKPVWLLLVKNGFISNLTKSKTHQSVNNVKSDLMCFVSEKFRNKKFHGSSNKQA